jgi:hypothetical protein
MWIADCDDALFASAEDLGTDDVDGASCFRMFNYEFGNHG